MISEEEKRQILKIRAEKLAQTRKISTQSKNAFLDLIQFTLGDEVYAIEAAFVAEVYPLRDVTKLPGTPAFLYGIMNVRRRIVAIVDLAVYFHLPQSEENVADEKSAIILNDGKNELAIITSQVLGALRMPHESIQPPLPSLTSLQQDFIKGVTHEGIVILNSDKLLNDSGLKIEDAN